MNDENVRFCFVDFQHQINFWDDISQPHAAISLPPLIDIVRQTKIQHFELSRVAERVFDKLGPI